MEIFYPVTWLHVDFCILTTNKFKDQWNTQLHNIKVKEILQGHTKSHKLPKTLKTQ